jgi:hypothetical protein
MATPIIFHIEKEKKRSSNDQTDAMTGTTQAILPALSRVSTKHDPKRKTNFAMWVKQGLLCLVTLRLVLMKTRVFSTTTTTTTTTTKSAPQPASLQGEKLSYLPHWDLIDQDSLVRDICTHPRRQVLPVDDAGADNNGVDDSWTIIMTLSDGYYDFFQNWYQHYQKLNLKLDIVLFAEDQFVLKHLQNANLPPSVTIVPTYLEKITGKNQDGPLSYEYNTWKYVKLVGKRPSRMLDVLCAGRNVLYVDADTVWKGNPLVHFHDDDDDDEYKNKNKTTAADIYMIVDHWIRDKRFAHGIQFCTGFLAVKANRKSLQLVSTWEMALTNRSGDMDQKVFNSVYSDMYRYRAVEENNITGVTMVIPYVQPLPRKLFPNGKDYFSKPFTKEDRDNVVQVHANFIIGHDKKKDRLKEFGLWLLDD